MTHFIRIENAGPDIERTNYWDSDLEKAGKIYCSVNAGVIRLLVPRLMYGIFTEIQFAPFVILSRGPWPAADQPDAVELLFEDNSDSPYCLHLSANSFDILPREPDEGCEWTLTAWIEKDGRPVNLYSRPVKWRRSARLPDGSPWSR